MKTLAFWSLFLVCFASFSKARTNWVDGKILLRTGEEIGGKICYNPRLDVVSLFVENDKRIQCFSAVKVSGFEFFDEEYEVIRRFVSYDFASHRSYRSKMFFEIVLDGKIMLIRRLITLRQNPRTLRESLDESFGKHSYFVNVKGSFVNLKRFKHKILPLISKDFEGVIEDFIDENHLAIQNRGAQIKLIDFYNFLSNDGVVADYDLYTRND